MSQSDQVHVVLHGTMAFVEEPDHIRALIPDMGNEHVYRAGLWLREVTLRKDPGDPYEFLGVKNAKGEQTTGNLDHLGGVQFVDRELRDGFQGDLFCEIKFPWPKRVWSGGGVKYTDVNFTKPLTSVSLAAEAIFAPVTVLTYDASGVAKPGLTKHIWGLDRDPGSGEFPRYHIFAEPDYIWDTGLHPAHMMAEFEAIAGFFDKLDLKMATTKRQDRTVQHLGGNMPFPTPAPGDPLSDEYLELAQRNGSDASCGQSILFYADCNGCKSRVCRRLKQV